MSNQALSFIGRVEDALSRIKRVVHSVGGRRSLSGRENYFGKDRRHLRLRPDRVGDALVTGGTLDTQSRHVNVSVLQLERNIHVDGVGYAVGNHEAGTTRAAPPSACRATRGSRPP